MNFRVIILRGFATIKFPQQYPVGGLLFSSCVGGHGVLMRSCGSCVSAISVS
jgi:hypothetical protein